MKAGKRKSLLQIHAAEKAASKSAEKGASESPLRNETSSDSTVKPTTMLGGDENRLYQLALSAQAETVTGSTITSDSNLMRSASVSSAVKHQSSMVDTSAPASRSSSSVQGASSSDASAKTLSNVSKRHTDVADKVGHTGATHVPASRHSSSVVQPCSDRS
jgi:hypothetical protein